MHANSFSSLLVLSALGGGLATGLLGSPAARASVLATQSFADFRGAGLVPGGGDGHLDSERWAVHGFSDGDSVFGDSRTSGDLARGPAVEPVRSGGLYAFALPGDEVGLGVQATSSDFSPGALLWRPDNPGELAWEALSLSFDLWVRNDGQRATRLAVDLAAENAPGAWIALPELSRVTPAGADSLGWQVQQLHTALPFPLPPGDALLLRFTLADAAGTGVRDEVAFGNFALHGETADGTPVVPLPLAGPLVLLACALPVLRPGASWRTRRRPPAGPPPITEA